MKKLIWYNNICYESLNPSILANGKYIENRKEGKDINYFKNGELHREDGPAVITLNKYFKHEEFWLNGIEYFSAEEWFDALTSEQRKKALFNLDEWK